MKTTALIGRFVQAMPLCVMALAASACLPISASGRDTPPDFGTLKAIPLSQATAPRSRAANGDMIAVPAGDYTIGRDDGSSTERPAHRIRLNGFFIDRTEVTNAAFVEFLNALPIGASGSFAAGEIKSRNVADGAADLLREGREGRGLYPIIALDDDQARIGLRDGRFLPTPGYEDHPVTETTWGGARAYCIWRGARLPSEAEWEVAARGNDGRRFPWGDERPTEDLVFVSGRTGATAPVGSRPAGASPFGALDMAGSLAEWTSSLKRPYPYVDSDGREAPDVAGERVTRGGDYIFDTDADDLTVTHRDGFSNAPERGHRHIGFRCAAARRL